ncbi:MAG: hypothetical protein WBY44_07540 [Bryobacteraceae bacterium]
MKRLLQINIRVIAIIFFACGLACAQQGLGHSVINSAGPCLDVDGDGYGVGPSCLGPDADDNDTNVHSPAQVIAKYGSINAFLLHLGYQSLSAPVPVYCISPTGNDSKGLKSTNADTACATPFQTWKGVYVHFQPAGVPAIIMFRAGTYNQQIMPNIGGTPSQSVYVMSYPGEGATIDYSASTGGAVVTAPYPYITVTNLRIIANRSGAGYSGGTYILYQKGAQNITFIGDVLQYCEISGGGTDSNVDADNTTNFTVQYNVVHDPATSGQHNIYLGSNTVTTTHAVVSNNILYSVHTGNYPNLQFNGRCTDCYFENNILYNSDGQEIAFLNGVSNSFLRNNLVFNTGVAGGRSLSFSLVNGNNTTQCRVVGVPSICAWDQTNNVIENNTFWAGTQAMDGSGALMGNTVEIINDQLKDGICGNGSSPPCGNLGGNYYRNNIIVGTGPAVASAASHSGYPPVVYYNASPNYLASDTWTDNIFVSQEGSPYVLGFGPGGSYGFYPYDCASFAKLALSSTGCSTTSPSFTNVNTNYWSTPWAYNFTPTASSATIGAGTSMGALLTDLYGVYRHSQPSIGAIEPAGGSISASGSGTIVTALSCTPLNLLSGAAATCNLTLAQPVGASGAVIAVSSNSPLLTVPTTVAVAANASAATFTATAGAILSAQTAVVSATLNGGSQSFSFELAAPTGLSSFSCSPATLTSGVASTCTVTLTQAAGTAGLTVALTSGATALTVPASVPVMSGSSTATFSATAGTIASAQSAVLTAILNGSSSTALISLNAAANSSHASWQQLANTTLQSACPANNFSGIAYAFSSNCPNVINAWGSAIADTQRNRLIIWGGGHGDYQGNEVYALNLTTSPPAMTRLTDPSAWNYSASYEVDPDGNPTSRHTYSDLVYLPAQDALFSFSGALPSGGGTNNTWMFTFADNKWHAKDPVSSAGFDPTTISKSSTGAACAYDPNTQTVFCIDGNTQYLLQYFPITNTYKKLSISANYALAATPAIDPVNKLMIFMGTTGNSVTMKVNAIDISGADPKYTIQDWTSQVTGCAAMGVNWPGLAFDSALGKLVGYPNQGSTVYVVDTVAKTCTAQALANGPQPASASNGTFGRFQYFPSLDSFVLVNAANQNAYSVQLNSTAAPPAHSACDLNGDGVVNALDVQAAINQALGIATCGTAALTGNGQCTVVDVQRVINASLGGACLTGF